MSDREPCIYSIDKGMSKCYRVCALVPNLPCYGLESEIKRCPKWNSTATIGDEN